MKYLIILLLLAGSACTGAPLMQNEPANPSTPSVSVVNPDPTGHAVDPTPTAEAAALTPTTQAAATGEFQDFVLHYELERSDRPLLTYRAITLKVYVGSAAQVSAVSNGSSIPVQYNPQTGTALITTDQNQLDVTVQTGKITSQTGQFSITPLKGDYQWAWSHSFDDNVAFEERGIAAFEQYGWRATAYLIGSAIDETRQENWIIDRPDIEMLLEKGWGIGNHSWSHATVAGLGGAGAARQDVAKLADYFRRVADEAGFNDYHPIAFAAPAFDSDYHPVILSLRADEETGLLFNESGDRAIVRVDMVAKDGEYPIFDPDAPVGRDWRIEKYGTNDEFDQAFRANLNNMLSRLDDEHHYWLNTFTHNVDYAPDDQTVFAFVDWLYHAYGPGGSDTVWVAPSEEIYSYLLLRSATTVKFTVSQASQNQSP